MKMEILGPGCAKCHAMERNVRTALEQLHTEAEVLHVYDPKEFAKRGVFFTPTLIIDGVTKISGKVPSVEEVKNLIQH